MTRIYREKLKLNPITELNTAADLVEVFGNVRLENGLTLRQALTIEGFSFWDVFAPELSHSHMPKILASKTSPNIFERTKPFISLIIIYVRRKIILFRANNPFVQYKINVVCLAFTNQMYRDVMNPIVRRLDRYKHINTLVLNEGRRNGTDNKLSKRCHLKSIWSFWDNDLTNQSSKLEIAFFKVRKETKKFNVLLDALPEDMKCLSDNFKLLFEMLFHLYLPDIIPRFVIARKILTLYRPKIVISPDVADSRARVYTMLARQYGMKSLDVQFGLAGREAVEWRYLSSDYVAAWGKVSKEAMLNQGVPESRILVTGSPRHDYEFEISKEELTNQRQRLEVPVDVKLFVLASTYSIKTHDKYSDPKVLFKMKKAIFDCFKNTEGAFLVVKPHPVESESEVRAMIRGSANIIQVCKNSDIREMIRICDGFISFGSTATIDALIANKITICPLFPGWEFSAFFKNSDAVVIPTSEFELNAVVRDISKGLTPTSVLSSNARIKFLEQNIFSLDRKATLRIVELIFEMISQEKCFE